MMFSDGFIYLFIGYFFFRSARFPIVRSTVTSQYFFFLGWLNFCIGILKCLLDYKWISRSFFNESLIISLMLFLVPTFIGLAIIHFLFKKYTPQINPPLLLFLKLKII